MIAKCGCVYADGELVIKCNWRGARSGFAFEGWRTRHDKARKEAYADRQRRRSTPPPASVPAAPPDTIYKRPQNHEAMAKSVMRLPKGDWVDEDLLPGYGAKETPSE